MERLRAERRARRDAGRGGVGVRAMNEDDDGYDPYTDYMDELARSGREDVEPDPWR